MIIILSIYISILWKLQMHCFKRSTAEKLILCELTYLGRVVILNDLHFLDRPTHRTLKLHIYMIVEQMSISKISYLIIMMVITMKMIIMVILIMKICILILVMMIVVQKELIFHKYYIYDDNDDHDEDDDDDDIYTY